MLCRCLLLGLDSGTASPYEYHVEHVSSVRPVILGSNSVLDCGLSLLLVMRYLQAFSAFTKTIHPAPSTRHYVLDDIFDQSAIQDRVAMSRDKTMHIRISDGLLDHLPAMLLASTFFASRRCTSSSRGRIGLSSRKHI
jgi:hypothetical protein